MTENENELPLESRKGFGALPPEKRREIASIGGKAAINRHKFDTESARAAGKKRKKVDTTDQNG